MSEDKKLKPTLPTPQDDHAGSTTGLAAQAPKPKVNGVGGVPAVVLDDHAGSEPV
ncbi:hypothetical protein ACH4PU_18215 [Streptomyces sp. NPDC021100]|uniref:hypothetical protein n=1 Tax=Streptomyces sp. NPDC021100 TaxID=3365114 RepID=UPI00378ABF15